MFTANAAWLTLAMIAHNLLRATGCLASASYAKPRGATLWRQLIAIPTQIARSGRGHSTVHLPEHWRWQGAWMNVFEATHQPPPQQVAQPARTPITPPPPRPRRSPAPRAHPTPDPEDTWTGRDPSTVALSHAETGRERPEDQSPPQDLRRV